MGVYALLGIWVGLHRVGPFLGDMAALGGSGGVRVGLVRGWVDLVMEEGSWGYIEVGLVMDPGR